MNGFSKAYRKFKALFKCQPVSKVVLSFRVLGSQRGWKVVLYFSNPYHNSKDFEIIYDGLKWQEAVNERRRLEKGLIKR